MSNRDFACCMIRAYDKSSVSRPRGSNSTHCRRDELLPHRPDRAGKFVAGADHSIERIRYCIGILSGQHQRRDELDDVAQWPDTADYEAVLSLGRQLIASEEVDWRTLTLVMNALHVNR